jgi:23S rRNA (uracil747-C5)-methyltransferase
MRRKFQRRAAVDPPAKLLPDQPDGGECLYATARDWVRVKHPPYVGSVLRRGGFGLHCATPEMQLTGIEISAEAIACAKQSAASWG